MDKRNFQNEILLKLIASNGLKFSEARPDGIENDLYNYHLQYLIKKKLVEKDEGLYVLSDKGKEYIEKDPIFSRKSTSLEPFKISVLLLATRVVAGETQVLLQTRTRHPYFGDTGILSGKVQREEKIVDAAKRKFFDETNLVADFKDIGLLRRVRYNKENNALFSDSFWFLCKSVSPVTGELNAEYIHGNNFWGSIDDAIKYEEDSAEKSDFMLDYFKRMKKDPELEIPYTFIEEYSKVNLD